MLLSVGSFSAPGQAADDANKVTIVAGLAKGDMLNLRAAASPTGMVIGRLPNGAALRSLGCTEVNGYRWCKVQAVDEPSLKGWTPARYLSPSPDDAVDVAETPAAGSPAASGLAPTIGSPDGSAERPATAQTPASGSTAAAALDGVEEGTAMRDGDPPEMVAAIDPADQAELPQPAPSDIPLPSPRPDRAAAVAAASEDALAVAAAPSGTEVTDEIPCARYTGQPMTRCRIEVLRAGSDSAEVTVRWPDGGERVIRFEAGKPAGSNSRREFRFTREGELNLIRVGDSERFEILDAIALGD